MSGILYVVMAILVILVVTTFMLWNRADKKWVDSELRWCGSELDRLKDLDTFKMHLDAKNQQIADIRRETEDEMRRLFENEVKSLHSEINRLCEERSKLQRTINLQGAQLEELEKLDEKSELSRISINGVPLTRKQLDDELESELQADYPSTWLYGDSDLLSYDHLYDTEVPSHKKGLKRGEEKLHRRKDNTRQSSYRQVAINLRKARKLVELQRLENEKVAKSEEDLARTRDIEEELAVIQERIDATPEGEPADQVALNDLYRQRDGLFWQLGQIEIPYYEGGE